MGRINSGQLPAIPQPIRDARASFQQFELGDKCWDEI
jgi:hypothetical protein